MSSQLRDQISPGLAPVSLTTLVKMLSFLGRDAIRASMSFFKGTKGIGEIKQKLSNDIAEKKQLPLDEYLSAA